MDLPEWAKAALVLAAGVVIAGVTDYFLARAGFEGLGMLVWAIGYGGAVFTVWFVWLRHLEFDPS